MTDDVDQLRARIDALEGMLSVVAAAPAIKRHVEQSHRVQAIRAAADRVAAFTASSDPAARFELVASLRDGDRRQLLADISAIAVTEFIRSLDHEQRARAARWFDEPRRRELACQLDTAIEFCSVRLADPTKAITISAGIVGDRPSDEPGEQPFALGRGGEALVMRRADLDAICERHAHVGEMVESGEIVVEVLAHTDRRAAGMKRSMVGSHKLIVDDQLRLWPSRIELGVQGARVVRTSDTEQPAEARDDERPVRSDPVDLYREARAGEARRRAEAEQRRTRAIADAVVAQLANGGK